VLDCDNVKNKQLSKEFEDYKIKFKPWPVETKVLGWFNELDLESKFWVNYA